MNLNNLTDSQRQRYQTHHAALLELWNPRIREAATKETTIITSAIGLDSGEDLQLGHRFAPLGEVRCGIFKQMVEDVAWMLAVEDPRCRLTEPILSYDDYSAALSEEQKEIITAFRAQIRGRREVRHAQRRAERFAVRYGLEIPEENPDQQMQHPHQLPPAPVQPQLITRRVRAKLAVIEAVQHHLQRGMTVQQAALLKGVTPRAIYRAKSQLRERSFVQQLRASIEPRPGPNSKYSSALDQMLFEELRDSDGMLTLSQLQSRCRERLNGHPVPSTMTLSRRLRKMRFTRKKIHHRPPQRNTPQTKSRRKVFFSQLLLALATGRPVISIDETGVSSEGFSGFHYSPSGQPWAFNTGRGRVPNTSCIFAISQERVEQSMFVSGGVDSVIFTCFLTHLVNSHPGFRDPQPSRRPVLIMDNAQIHHSKLLKIWVAGRGVDVIWAPPHNPFCNMVEFLNCRFKAFLRGQDIRTPERMAASTNILLYQTLETADFTGYFERTLTYTEAALEEEDINN